MSSRSAKEPGPKRPFQTLYFRFALTFFFTMALAAGILFGGTFITLYRSLQQEDQVYTQRKLLAYWARFQSEEIEGLTETLRNETLIYDERPFFVRLANSRNETLFLGYPEHWGPFDIQAQLEAYDINEFQETITIEAEELDFSIETASIALDNRHIIQVGMSTERRDSFLRLYQRNYLFFLLFVLLFALAAGLFIASRAVVPLRRLSLALNSIIRTGDLSARIPVRESGDELDELGNLFNQLLERIQGLIARMRETLDTVAHDLRTPLTRLRGSAELALQSSDADRHGEALSDALEESDRILTQLNALMDISEADSGILKLHKQPIDPREQLERVIEIYTFLAEERDIRIELSGSFPTAVEADPVRLQQICGNLLDNAVKYSYPEKTVRLRGSEKSGENGRLFVLEVENRGPQLAEDEIDRIWDRLYRARENRSPGLGLGLSLVRAVAEAHNGTAAVENIDGGVRFTIALPLH